MGFLEERVALELAGWGGFKAAGLDEKKIAAALGKPPKPEMGDMTFATFRHAKEAGKNPAECAASLIADDPSGRLAKAGPSLIQAASAAGPYVNLTLNHAAVAQSVLDAAEKQDYGNSETGKGRTLVVDLSSPNIAKPLAVHHLRSTMIGNSIKKIRESQGWRVVGVNHLGDWGTGFGKLIAGLKRIEGIADRARKRAQQPLTDKNYDVLPEYTVRQLNAEYQKFNEAMKSDPELEDAGKHEFALLEQTFIAENAKPGSAVGTEGYANLYIYRSAREKSLRDFARVYQALGISFEPLAVDRAQRLVQEAQLRDGTFPATGIYIGESHWGVVGARCQPIVDAALQRGVAERSDGAVVLWVNGKKPGKDGNPPPPVILLKDDGASSYHLRDIASASYRHEDLCASALAYVVGSEQKLHFDQLFKALAMLGAGWAQHCTHVDFGLMLFKNDKGAWEKTSTRRGTAIMLEDLLDEAVKSVREIMAVKNPELANKPDAEAIAQAVGVGAVVFNDLKNGRRNNVKFDWDAVLDFEGESGPYMLYQYVRMGSVTAKFESECKAGRYDAGWQPAPPVLTTGDATLLATPEEWNIVLQLAAFPDAVAKASDEYEPSIVARYLIELASLTSTWWTATRDSRIVGDKADLSLARVRLVNAIRKVLGRGLQLLGMSLVERM